MVKLKRQKIRLRKKATFSQKIFIQPRVLTKVLTAIVIVGAIGAGLVRLQYMFADSEYFIVKDVNVEVYDDNGTPRKLSIKEVTDQQVEGQNIFFIDLEGLKKAVENAHPEFKDIEVRRLLPNRLVVQAKLRKPVAQIRSDRYYFVDRDGVFLPDVKNFPDPYLPIIAGIGGNLAKVSTLSLSEFEREKLNKALNLINEIKSIEGLKNYRLQIVDVTDPGNLTFSFEAMALEIKIGNADFHNRLKVLATVLTQLGPDITKFKYIDLRFEDPIVGPL